MILDCCRINWRVMELLPIEQERLLVEIAPHSCEPDYFKKRFEELGESAVWDDSGAIQALKEAGLIEYEGSQREIKVFSEVAGQRIEQTLKYWDMFALTANGASYLRRCTRERTLARVRVVLEVAGSVAAVVNLILYVIWR